MLHRTRVSSKMDVGRLSAAVARPGIDPRTWVSLAVALADSVVDTTNLGVFVQVQLMPTGEVYTARVPSIYAGAGFGLYTKVDAGTELVVVVPSGDPATGCVVVSRAWNGAHPPPPQATANPNDLIIVLEPAGPGGPDANLQIHIQGQGTVTIDTMGGDITVNALAGNVNVLGGMINLADAQPADFVALATNTEARLAALEASMDAAAGHTHLSAAPSSPTGPPVAVPPVVPGQPVTATKVKAT